MLSSVQPSCARADGAMSFHAWLHSIAGVGYKKGDVDLGEELTGVKNYFDPSRDVYWNVRRQGPIAGPDGKPIEELSQVAAMNEGELQQVCACARALASHCPSPSHCLIQH